MKSKLISRVLSLSAALVLACDASASPADSIHGDLDASLSAHVRHGVVDYPGLAGDPRFAGYLEKLAALDPATLPDPADRLTYWINAYNAFAIKGILDGYSPSSFLSRVTYFKTRKYVAGGEPIDLHALERKVLIPMGEPRIHFAIVCASRSCPKLPSHAYHGERLEEQLERSAREFVNDRRRNRFDPQAKVAYLSRIFDWFAADFEREAGSLQTYVARYVDDPGLARELESGSYRVRFLEYDWGLNGEAPRR